MTVRLGDLAVLIADKNMEGALRGLLSRPQSLGLREISCKFYVHPERDPGCLLRGHDFAQKVSFDRCIDPSFLRLRQILSNWFSR